MARHWEKFTGGPTVRSRDHMHVTLNSKGLFQLNHKTYSALGKPQAVVLFFEKQYSIIGISPAHAKLSEAFLVKPKMDFGWTINAIPFCRHFGIQIDGTEAFVNPDVDEQGILQLDLRCTRRVFGGKRKAREKSS